MEIRMSSEIRTQMRKMLRDHPDILQHVASKSEVNNLSKDRLIEVADRLEINFMKKLKNEMDYNDLVRFDIDVSDLSRAAFEGAILTDCKISAFGKTESMRLKASYEFTPSWQFACSVDRRLKYRDGGGISMEFFLEVRFMPEDDQEPPNGEYWTEDTLPLRWINVTELMSEYEFFHEACHKAEQEAIKTDKASRKKLGLPPLKKYPLDWPSE